VVSRPYNRNYDGAAIEEQVAIAVSFWEKAQEKCDELRTRKIAFGILRTPTLQLTEGFGDFGGVIKRAIPVDARQEVVQDVHVEATGKQSLDHVLYTVATDFSDG
jgi:hypothetical protein